MHARHIDPPAEPGLKAARQRRQSIGVFAERTLLAAILFVGCGPLL
jgi:hypothetical protein